MRELEGRLREDGFLASLRALGSEELDDVVGMVEFLGDALAEGAVGALEEWREPDGRLRFELASGPVMSARVEGEPDAEEIVLEAVERARRE